MAGCEGYGCEPVFALAYIRHVNDNGKDLQLTYASPLFEKALIECGLDEDERKAVIEQVMQDGSCQSVEDVPDKLRDVFVVSQDITAEEHVRMQAAMQAFVDNSLSKTINFNAGATVDDVATAYRLAWKLGCKGITVYVTGSRETVVLETLATADKKKGGGCTKNRRQSAPVKTIQPTDADGRRAQTAPARPARLHLLHTHPAGQGLHHHQRERRQPAL